RWFKRRFPALGHGRLEKLLRTGQVRLDGGRAKAADRVTVGQRVRVPPLGEVPPPAEKRELRVRDADARDLKKRVLHRDASVLVIDKPPGLATQGGSKLDRHLDAMLDALRFDAAERPRLVHRLDKDTSGVLVLARTRVAATKLAEAFRHKSARKVYWALVAGVPKLRRGRIDVPLAKVLGPAGERVMADDDAGKRAVTWYAVVETAGRRAAWLALMPETGRTHQLRAHCAYLGTPIVGDGKYGADTAGLGAEISRKLHLHARSLTLPHPDGGTLSVTAPLPAHMRETWAMLGFEERSAEDPFADLEL
ncbi:MAG TPA: RluA family pseudouridine synthase, partial [Candidatus Cybelea sp.]|nr:RluA family pseudouridine synthase [Candidatus Cybelea sp.]